MDKNKFWLGGRLFNTASLRLADPMQRKARPQDGRPNATQGLSASWAPTQRKARPQVARPNVRLQRKRKARPQRKAHRHVHKLGAPMKCKSRPQRKARQHVRKLGAPMQCKARP
jgi:hypothetical protein